jgi:hypothetical protein
MLSLRIMVTIGNEFVLNECDRENPINDIVNHPIAL